MLCAIREIKEEIRLDLTNKIKPNQFIEMQTLRNKWIKLFIVSGVDEQETL